MSESIDETSLKRLIASYPAHGFVIDRKEAGKIFTNVSKPSGETTLLYEWVRVFVADRSSTGIPIVLDLGEIVGELPVVSKTAKKAAKKAAKK